MAEDDPLLRLDARLTLEDEGFAVIEAPDAPTALVAIQEHAEVEALFTDVQMPGPFGGLDLAHRAAHLRPGLAVIVASGDVRLSMSELPVASRFFPKPYEMDAVVRALRDVIVA